MDASALECERVPACSFMVMTAEGPLSMCVHNAKRDAFLLRPLAIKHAGEQLWWDPVSGRSSEQPPTARAPQLSRKNARGRARAALLDNHKTIPIEVIP